MPIAEKTKTTCAICGTAVDDSSADLGCPTCLFQTGLEEIAERLGIRAPPDQLSDQFGPYTISKRDDGTLWVLGRGAMGVTYRAMDASLRRPVALKIIQSDLKTSNAEARERFLREARAAATLQHQNVATAYHFGIREETGQYYYAMELIEGETLEERVRRSGPLDIPSTIAIAQQVAAALAAAEKRGLIHRDLKPANLMLVSTDDEDQTQDRHRKQKTPLVKIIDFGLAKALKAEADPMTLTRNGFVGTPAFASPEQFGNAPLDVRSDIYSLGLTLWFALTGKTPFQGRSVEEIRNTQQSGELSIQQLKAARVSSRLIALLQSMLAIEPAARPGTDALVARLRSCAASANPTRKRLVFALATTLIFLLVTAAWFVSRPSPKHESGGTSNTAAREAYLKGRYLWNKRTTENYKPAQEYFEKAIELDPNYAQSYAALGDIYQFLADADVLKRGDYFARAKNANKKALELDPGLSEAHASLGLIAMNYDWNWATAEREFRRAIELNPSYATAHHWLGEYLVLVGRFDEGLREIERARELDPLSLAINNDLGKLFFFARKIDKAEAQLRETIKLNADVALPHFWLGLVYAEEKYYDLAIAQFKEAERIDGGSWPLGGLGYVYGLAGEKNDAQQILATVKKQLSISKPFSNLPLAYVFIGLGDNDRALACLEDDYRAHTTSMTSLKVAPLYDPLRSDPRFVDLLRRVHLDR